MIIFFSIVLLITVLLLFLVLRTSPTKKGTTWFTTTGDMGEKVVAKILSKLPQDEYKIINNLLIRYGEKSTQIDHVVLSQYGIFVIETKNYKGWIYGGPDSEYWTQNIYGNKYKLYNPLFQNQSHIKSLCHLLPKLSPSHFISIVAFSKRATLKNRYLNNVIYWNRINKFIRSYSQKKISLEIMQDAYNILLNANCDSSDTLKLHIKNVRHEIHRHQTSVDNGFCPKCGAQLVLRKGSYGKFYGCSNYPRCRFTHNL